MLSGVFRLPVLQTCAAPAKQNLRIPPDLDLCLVFWWTAPRLQWWKRPPRPFRQFCFTGETPAPPPEDEPSNNKTSIKKETGRTRGPTG